MNRIQLLSGLAFIENSNFVEWDLKKWFTNIFMENYPTFWNCQTIKKEEMYERGIIMRIMGILFTYGSTTVQRAVFTKLAESMSIHYSCSNLVWNKKRAHKKIKTAHLRLIGTRTTSIRCNMAGKKVQLLCIRIKTAMVNLAAASIIHTSRLFLTEN